MMHHYAIYEIATGKVVGAGRSNNARVIEVNRNALAEGCALYEGEIDPATTYLPGGVPAPLQPAPVVITAAEVKAHAGRLLSYTDWVVVRALDTGTPADPDVIAYRQAVRDASNALEAMNPIPADFTDPKHWPARP